MGLKKLFLAVGLLITSLQAGEYADAFILASVYPQSQSLGNSTVASHILTGHALNNPAGFAHLPRNHVSLIYDQFNGLTNNYGLEAQISVSENYIFGLSAIHTSIEDLFFRPDLNSLSPLDRRDSVLALANINGEIINYREDAIFLSIAREYSFDLNLGWKFFKIPFRVPIGFTLKYLDKLLVDNRGLGSGIDFGSQIYFNFAGMSKILSNTEYSVGLFLSDILNTPVYWDTEHQDAIKRNFTRGFTLHQTLPKYSTEILLSSSSQSRYPEISQYGLEVKVKEMVAIRAGHNGYIPSFGLGISLKKFIIAYSFSQHDLAGMQNIEINFHF